MMFLNADCYAALSPGARQLFSGLLASIAGGRRFLPGDGERRRIERMLSGQDAPRRLTVFGALIERGEKGAPHRFRRERRNLPKLDLVPGQHIVWDGRFCFFNSGGRSFEIAPPGRQELIDFLKNSGRDIESRRCEALLISPALYEGGKLAFVPFLPGAEWPQGVHIERHLRFLIMSCPAMILRLHRLWRRALVALAPKYPNFCKPEREESRMQGRTRLGNAFLRSYVRTKHRSAVAEWTWYRLDPI